MKYMRYRYGLLSLIFLLSFFSASLAFYDDFQIYNSVTNPYFTSNYTLNDSLNNNSIGMSNFTIGSAANVYLTYRNNYGGAIADRTDLGAVLLNYSKISANANFRLNFSILSGSVVASPSDSGILSIGYFVNNTDSSDKNLNNLRGYIVNFGYLYSSYSQYIELRRCTSGLDDPLNCGVQLAYGAFNLTNTYLGLPLTVGAEVNNSIFVDLTYSPATSLLSVNIAGMPVLNVTDTVYTSGGFILYGHHSHVTPQTENTNLMLDNLSISGVTAAGGQDWQVVAFPTGITNFFGAGAYDTNYCSPAYLYGTSYHAAFNPCVRWFAGGYPTQNRYLQAYVIKYQNQYLTQTLYNTLNITSLDLVESASLLHNCFLVTGGANDFDMYNAGLATQAQKFALYDAEEIASDTSPLLFLVPIPFYCGMPDNISVNLQVVYGVTFDVSLLFSVPIGYPINPDGSVNYSVTITPFNNSLYTWNGNNTIVPIVPSPTSTGDTIGRIALALVDPSVVVLYLVIFMGAIVTYFTKNGVFGGITLLVMMLVMASIGLITSWFIWLLILICAIAIGAFIIKAVGSK